MRGSEYFELLAFSKIVEYGSFTEAAQYLRVTPSALSQIIRQLEKRLGVRLLNRTTRSLSLTDAGTRMMSRLHPALREIDAALEDINNLRASPTGTLRLHLPRLAVKTFLEPLLERFRQAYPDIVLDITVDDSMVNIVEHGFDLGIRLGEFLEGQMVALPIGPPLRHIPVATPAYLAEFGIPERPDDLQQHRCINWRQHGSRSLQAWEFKKGRKSLAVFVTGPLIVSERNLALSAALQGVGIAFVAEQLAMPFINKGKLVTLLSDWCAPFAGWHVCYHKQQHTPETVKAFVRFAHSVLKKT
ncbi:MAG: LysR family transcriptional regulator [Polaromonas sp.]|nr:LysR family transcriptional regulator [Polaromonas sp.]